MTVHILSIGSINSEFIIDFMKRISKYLSSHDDRKSQNDAWMPADCVISLENFLNTYSSSSVLCLLIPWPEFPTSWLL